MDVLETIKKRRTISTYKTIPVSQDTLEILLEAGRLASSWGNTQTWRWVVIQDQNLKMQIAEKVLRPGNRGTDAVATRYTQ